MGKAICKFGSCTKPVQGRGYCSTHFKKLRADGTLPLLPIPTEEERFWAKVNKTETCWLWTGALRPNGYGAFRADSKAVRAHRYSYKLAHGSVPDGDLDHICGVRACVNPDHLRPVSRKQNMENITVLRSDNSSGYRGVYLQDGKRYIAQVTHNGVTEHLGCFSTVEEAAEAARLRRIELYTHNERDRIA